MPGGEEAGSGGVRKRPLSSQVKRWAGPVLILLGLGMAVWGASMVIWFDGIPPHMFIHMFISLAGVGVVEMGAYLTGRWANE